MFSLLEARDQDIPAIIDLAEKTWWPAYSKILSPDQISYMLSVIYAPGTLRKQMTDGSQTYLIVKTEDGPQGFAAFGPRTDAPDVFKLYKLYVLPSNQHKGCGRALIEEVKRRLLSIGVHTLDLNVNRHNPAKDFYEKLGFTVIREEDIPVGPYWMNDYVMRLTF